MRRTVSNLSREMRVSRPTIYKAMERQGIKKTGGEYPLYVWEALKKELLVQSQNNADKLADAKNVSEASEHTTRMAEAEQKTNLGLLDIETSTLRERLLCSKGEFDYNRILIVCFQNEIDTYRNETGRTTMKSHNGTMASIPAVVNLEKYIKLNIALSKLISELESDLDLEVDGGDDPFA